MKKISFIGTIFVASVLVTPVTILSSCNKNKSHFIEPEQKDKEIVAEDGYNYGIYEIKLNTSIDNYQHLEAVATTTSSSTESLSANIRHIAISDEDPSWIWFVVRLDGIPTNNEYWAIFDTTITCKNIEGNVVWSETIKNFKLTANITPEPEPTIETHSVTTNNAVNNIVITSSGDKITPDQGATLTISNNRGMDLTNGILTTVVGTNKIMHEDIVIPTAGKQLEISIDSINEKLVAAGFEAIAKDENISIYLAKKDTYKIDANKCLEKCDEYGCWSSVSDLTTVQNKFLVFDSINNEYILKDGSITGYLNTLSSGSTAQIYLLNGTEYVVTAPANPVTLELNGTYRQTSNGLVKTSAFKGYTDNDWYLDISNINLELNDLNVLCMDSDQTHVSQYLKNGFRSNTLKATNCDFVGPLTIYSPGVTFNNCTFDTRDICYFEGGANKNMYAVWFYVAGSGNFKDCTFYSGGKAVKYYADGSPGVDINSSYSNCKFILDQSRLTAKGYANVGIKYPFEIDGYGLHPSGQAESLWSHNYITITNCTYEDYPSSIDKIYDVENAVDIHSVNRVHVTVSE